MLAGGDFVPTLHDGKPRRRQRFVGQAQGIADGGAEQGADAGADAGVEGDVEVGGVGFGHAQAMQ